MDMYLLLSLLLSIDMAARHGVNAQAVNVALGRTVSAQYTCGMFGKEIYVTLQDAHKAIHQRQERSCVDLRITGDAGVVKTPSYPVGAMVDGNVNTSWLSAARHMTFHYGTLPERDIELEAVVTLDLEQEFLAERITVIMGDALSPQKLAILKSLDGKTYQKWIFGVTSLDMCMATFGVERNRAPVTLDDHICLPYSADYLAPGDTITFDLSHISSSLREWQRIRFLQIKFYDMLFVSPYSPAATSFAHYAVRELQVLAECPCNGQQTGCQLNPASGVYECVCGFNTRGRFCEFCLEKFNQFKFENGRPCRECNCFGHADSCFYSQSVEEALQSIDIDGNRLGGGVCFNCQHNTDGVNCERCINMFYRPQGRDQRDTNVCVPCGCSQDGSTLNPDTGLVDCVMSDDEARSDGKIPGDCFCKVNVEGTKCDTCKAGFYNLDISHDEGCIECSCFTPGTAGASSLCVGDKNGQCTCKPNVEGRTCNECKDGYFGLTDDDANGCEPCNCNIGGAVDQNCNKVTGQCACRSDNIVGRACDSVNVGYFYPSSHAINVQLEDGIGEVNIKSDNQYSGFTGKGYVAASEDDIVRMLLSIPGDRRPSEQYIIILRYRTPVGQTTSAVIEIMTFSSSTTPVSLTLPVCGDTWCQVDTGTAEPFQLTSFPVLIYINVTSGNVLLDKLVAMPVEYTNAETLLSTTLPPSCSFIQNIMPPGEEEAKICRNALFTITMLYWKSPLPCDCHVTGSVDTVCDANGGQCRCRTGVMGRQCSSCSPDHYGFTEDGCMECNCDGASSSCDAVSGQCECPDNTISRQCDLCLPYHWGLDRTTGCQACGCNELGSAFLQCNGDTGVCMCKPGVEGEKCDKCQDNYYGLGRQGCSPCECDTRGSVNTICNQTSGICDCKENTMGRQCNECSLGTFGLHSNNPQGCLNCICMGISTNCTSANLKIDMGLFALITPTEGGSQPRLALVGEDGTPSDAEITIDTNEGGQTFFLSVNFIANANSLFWAMPVELRDNLLDLYGSVVNVEVNTVLVDGTVLGNLRAILLTSDGTRLTTSFGPVQNGFKAEIALTLRETEWQQEGTTTPLTRGEFLKALSQTSHFLIPATHSTSAHTSSIASLQFGTVGATGVEIMTVEECVCGEAYSGRSCENCAEGYRRQNEGSSEFFGTCVPCECNGHSSTCDEATGECIDCQHNTTGTACELCENGFYGDALGGTDSDCLPCPCFQPRVVDATCTVNSTGNGDIICSSCREGYEGNECDQCSASYFGNPQTEGGTCSPCQCNSNADSCNTVTGTCENCRSNTVGDNCERCADNFYGDASTQSCTECGCVDSASNSTLCNAASGQCPCHPGVVGRTCDQCQEGFWGYDNEEFQGCQECQCLQAGSQQTQCNLETGLCSCRENTNGDRCDSCSENFFGLPDLPCEACACDTTGTVPGTQCNPISGQCTCQPGVTGRQCDQCLPLYTEFSSSGCTACDECQRALGDSMEIQSNLASQYLKNAKTIFDVQDEDSRLQILERDLQKSLEQLGLNDTDATSVADVTGDISNQMTELSSQFQNTNNMVTTLQAESSNLLDRSQAKATEETMMSGNGTTIVSQLTTFEREANSGLRYLTEFNTSASELSARGSQATSVTIDLTEKLALVDKLLSDVQNTSRIDEIIDRINEQDTASTSRLTSVENLMQDYTTLEGRVDELISNHSRVSFSVIVVDDTLDEALTFKSQAEELDDAADKILDNSESRNTELASTLAAALQKLQRTRSVYSGNAISVIDGEGNMPFPPGITNFETGRANLTVELQRISTLVTETEERVTIAETHAVDLQTSFNALNSTYQNLPDIGREAKNAIDNYEQVILDLNNALMMANIAGEVIAKVQEDISGDALEQRRISYNEQRNRSEILREELTQLDLQPQVLENEIQSAQDRLGREVDEWNTLDEKLSNMSSQAQSLSQQLEGNTLLETINEAVESAQSAKTSTDNIAASIERQSVVLGQKEAELNITRDQIQETLTLDTTVRDTLSQYQNGLASFMSNLTEARGKTTQFETTSNSISSKIALLEDKLARAESLLSQLRQPVTFDGNLNIQVENPQVNTPRTYDHVSMNVRRASGFTDGNIFFSENTQNDEELEIGLSASKIFLEFHTGADTVRVTNPTEICDDCWAEVQASRIGNVGYLSVTDISTGAVSSQDSRGADISPTSSITLTSPLFIGSLPEDTTISKVTNKEFQGCLNEVEYQHQAINLWSAAVASSQEPGCCQVPPAGPQIPAISGASFSGFGFAVVRSPDVSFANFESISLEFRTFSPDGYLFLIISADSQTRLSLRIISGNVRYDLNSNGASNGITSDNSYNNGEWITVTATLTENQMTLSTGLLASGGAVQKVLDITPVDLSALQNQNIILGVPSNPFQPGASLEDGQAALLENINDEYFSGCIRNVDLDISSFGPATRLTFTSDVVIQNGVNLNSCPQNVVNGITFLSSTAYMKLSPDITLDQLSTLEMTLQTTETQAILVYINAVAPARSLYMALFGGNVIVYYSQETSATLISTGTFVSDGREHTIIINALTSRVSLQVDGSIFEESSSTLSTPHLSFASNAELYLGGVPESITLTNRPVRKSFIGGITRFVINGNNIAPIQSLYMEYKDVSLEGVARSLNTAVLTLDDCGTRATPTFLPAANGALFDGSNSAEWTRQGELSDQLRSGFSFTMAFSAYKADGVLFYASDSIVNPNNYLTLFLLNGFLHVKFRTSLGIEREITSGRQYNDAQRYELSMTRINDLIELSVQAGDEYQNSGINSATVSTLEIPLNVAIYIGGIGNHELIRTPLPDELKSTVEFVSLKISEQVRQCFKFAENWAIQLVSFGGAIFTASLQDTTVTRTFDVGQLNRNTFPSIPSNVVYGVSLNGQASYLLLDQQTTSPNEVIVIGMTIRTTTQSASLFLLHESQSKYVAVDYDQNKIYVHLSPSFEGITGVSSLTAFTFSGTSVLCDGNVHSLTFTFQSNTLTTEVDADTATINIPVSHAIQPMTDADFFVAGMTGSVASTLPDTLKRTSMEGCVETISVTKAGAPTTFDPTRYANTSSGLSYGCFL